jgi:hypothetical protein
MKICQFATYSRGLQQPLLKLKKYKKLILLQSYGYILRLVGH